MPSPALTMPFSASPELGTSWPIASEVFGPSSAPVTGFLAWRLVPEQGLAPAQPGT